MKLLTALFFASLVSLSLTQLSAQSSIALGAKIGASFSGFRGEDAGDISFHKGVAGGLFLAVSPAGFFTVQPELLFQQKGAVSELEEVNIRQDVKIGYLNIPVLLKFRLPLAGTFYPHVYVGPQFSYRLKSEYTIEALNLGSVTREVDLRNYDLGGVFGFGLDVQFERLFITGDFRYALGAFDVDEGEDFEIKNKDIAVLAGVGFIF